MTALCYLLFVAATADAAPSLRFEAAGKGVRVRASFGDAALKGVPAGALTQAQGEAWLTLGLIDPDTKALGPAMLGAYARKGGEITFTPRHSLLAGQRYRATLLPRSKSPTTADHVVAARKPAPRAAVEKVYPTADVLPANQLKFYIYFSQPMRESRTIFDHIHVLDDKGDEVIDPWRRTELWSADGKRLTLWVHPGRLKKGVNLNEELGPVLEEGRSYSLAITAKLLDADGQPLAKAFTKKFKTSKAIRTVVDVDEWKLAAPKAGGREALTITFPRPLDHALLGRFVEVFDEDGVPVRGAIAVGKEERSITFVPAAAWQDQEHRVVVDGRLEDLAGNSVEQIFDVDRKAPTADAPKQSVKFTPKR